MKAVGYTADGPLENLELPEPEPEARDLLVRVKAIAVNPVDAKIRGRIQPTPADPPKILGWDAVGEVVATGSEVSLFQPGDRVWYAGDVTRPGCNAELQCVDERIAGRAPQELDDARAAAMPLTTITAWEMLFERLQLPRGENPEGRRLLIVGAGGGVGSMLVQLARQLTSVEIVATASRPDSRQWVRDLGAHHVIDHSHSLQKGIRDAGVGPITDVASTNRTGEHFDELVSLLAPQGRLALIDDPADGLDIMKMKQKSLSLHWEFMFTRAMFDTKDMQAQHALLSEVAELVEQSVLRTTMGEHYGRINAENMEKAHAAIKSEHTVGKIVMEGF